MEQKLSKEKVAYVAKLASLGMPPRELEKYQVELSMILNYVEQIQQLDTTGIPATFQVLPLKNILRDDQTSPGLTVEEALLNAPDRENNYFKMPKIMEQTSVA